MAPRFFCEKLEGGTVVLAGDEFHHLRAVRRLGAGDEVELFDGRGRLAVCTVLRIGKREAELEVREASDCPPPRVQLTLATAIPKGERMDGLVEKATELGVWALWPLVTERSVVKDVGQMKHEGWKRRAVEASKQCGRVWVPEIAAPMPLAGAIEQQGAMLSLAKACPGAGGAMLTLLADPSAEAAPILQVLGHCPIPAQARAEPSRILGFVGPEGGFTAEESAALRSAGAMPVRLGEHILRIETAAVALCAAVGLRAGCRV